LEGERDRDRILYTSAFRRLAGVTQVVSPTEGHIFHNRMTHTLEVAQIGRRLAERIDRSHSASMLAPMGGLDASVVEAAALVHDLGHPPFGHVAEVELQRLLDLHYPQLSGSFEGNAQSFRIVTKLAVHRASPANPSENYLGINLTRASLNAALKYPWERDTTGKGHKHRKWGVYETERSEFVWARRQFPPRSDARTLEADLMDWADDVAYSVHDLEDFFRAGLIPLERLAGDDDEERRLFWKRYTERLERDKRESEDTPGNEPLENLDALKGTFGLLMELVATFGIAAPFDDSRSHRGYLRGMTAFFIDRYINALTILEEPDEEGSWVEPDESLACEVRLLKALTWEYVIDGPSVATQQLGQQRIIRELFLEFTRAVERRQDWKLFPRPYQDELARVEVSGEDDVQEQKIRIVVDLVASMTEQQALRVYQRVTGHAPGSVLGPY
jgi:dGTPase